MSDDHKDRFPKLSDGVDPDWRTWLQQVMPELYGKTSAAYPDKNLYQVLEMVPPRERGPLVTPIEEQIEIPRMCCQWEAGPKDAKPPRLAWLAAGLSTCRGSASSAPGAGFSQK